MKKDLVKQDLNFMEFPMWFQDERLANSKIEGYVWKDVDGFTYRAGYKPPVKTDIIFLIYLLAQSQKQGWTTELTLSRYQIIKNCNLMKSKFWYDRLEESLKRWKMIGLEFEGCFYDGKEYLSMNFGIVDSWILDKKSSMLHIRLSPLYLTKIRESKFFRYLDFEEIKELHSPLATRLYEIVIKMFQGRSIWEIDCLKLAQKIPMNEKYPSNIVPKIKTAVNRINEKTSLNLALHIRQVARGKTFIGFEKISVKSRTSATSGFPETEEFKSLVALLPDDMRNHKTILNMLQKACNKYGHQYVVRNIQYCNRNAKTSYRPYLNKALKNDYGLADEEDQKARNKKAELHAVEQRTIIHKRQQEEEARLHEEKQIRKAIKDYSNLPQEDQDRITTMAFATFNDSMKQYVQQKKTGWKMVLNGAIRQVMSIEEKTS